MDAPLIRYVKTFALFLENSIIKRLREGDLIWDKFGLCSDSTKNTSENSKKHDYTERC